MPLVFSDHSGDLGLEPKKKGELTSPPFVPSTHPCTCGLSARDARAYRSESYIFFVGDGDAPGDELGMSVEADVP